MNNGILYFSAPWCNPCKQLGPKMDQLQSEGIAIKRVVNVNTDPKNGFIPVTNIWCPQTIVDKNAIANIEIIIAL